MYTPLSKAAEKLGITTASLRDELKKPDCPYGGIRQCGKMIVYFISDEKLDKWIEEHPDKYENNPHYSLVGLSKFSSEELIRELKRRGEI